ncbi:hypothetical protein HZH68_013362 [Vespula germanica]|uniref:Uncharacterized protein n=1 Tax=Vespula germanica TaxID=30212 RepID=A0A834JDW7_VESGE|nr:hypothetical protein HZH68_013362 [Vespula germanica]
MAVETGFSDGGERTMSISPLVPELRNERAVSRNKRGGEPKLLLEVLPEWKLLNEEFLHLLGLMKKKVGGCGVGGWFKADFVVGSALSDYGGPW